MFFTLWLLLLWLLSGDNTEAGVTNLMPQSSWRKAKKKNWGKQEKESRVTVSECESNLFFLTDFRLSGGLWSHVGDSSISAD